MKYFSSIVVFLILLSSCQDVERMEKPDNLIPEDKMVDLITEISLLQAARNYNKRMMEEKGLNPESYLWEKFDVDSVQFEKSSNYYAEHYDRYEAIYARVKARLEGYRDVYDSLREAEERVQDSLLELEAEDTPLKEGLETAPDTLKNGGGVEPREISFDSIQGISRDTATGQEEDPATDTLENSPNAESPEFPVDSIDDPVQNITLR